MEDIVGQFQSELINIIQNCFYRTEVDSKETDSKTQKRDVKGEFLDKVTPYCVAFIEQRSFDIENVSQFFNVKYSDLLFQNLSRDFKLMHSEEYKPAFDTPTPTVYLCRMFMSVLNRLTAPPTSTDNTLVPPSPENIRNISIAIADLFLSINSFVLYHCAKQELMSVPQNNKKNQAPQYTIITRLVDKLAPLVCPKTKLEALKLACYQTPSLQLNLIQSAELKRTTNESHFNWSIIDTYPERRDFSPITAINNIRDTDKISYWESQSPINFSTVIIPLVHEISETQSTDLVSKLKHRDESEHSIISSKFKVQIGTIGSILYIFDLLNVEERNVGLTDMTWIQRIQYLKKSLNVTGDSFEQYKIVEPMRIHNGLLNVKLQNDVPKFIVIKTLGFGLYRSFYSSPKSLKRPHDEKTQTAEEPTTSDSGKKIRF